MRKFLQDFSWPNKTKVMVTLSHYPNKQLFKEGIAMKKTTIYTVATSLFLFLIVSAAHAQVAFDRVREGMQIVEKSRFLMAEGKMLKEVKAPDRAWLVDEGHLLIKQGTDATESGEMMVTDEGRPNMEQIGEKLRGSGSLLLKMGRQKGEVTQKEKEALIKEGDTMIGIGKLMLEKGKFMSGE
jgi:hypothetical protein